jgi:hypothetical protein
MATKKKSATKKATVARVKSIRSQYGKELVRVGIDINRETAQALEAGEKVLGVAAVGVIVDAGNGKVWLVYSVDDEATSKRFWEATQPLPMKMAGYLTKEKS